MEDFKEDIDSNTIIVGDFNTPLSKINRSSKQNINKDIVSLNNTLDEKGKKKKKVFDWMATQINFTQHSKKN